MYRRGAREKWDNSDKEKHAECEAFVFVDT